MRNGKNEKLSLITSFSQFQEFLILSFFQFFILSFFQFFNFKNFSFSQFFNYSALRANESSSAPAWCYT